MFDKTKNNFWRDRYTDLEKHRKYLSILNRFNKTVPRTPLTENQSIKSHPIMDTKNLPNMHNTPESQFESRIYDKIGKVTTVDLSNNDVDKEKEMNDRTELLLAIENISNKDPILFQNLTEFIKHASETFSDKYAQSAISTMSIICNKELGIGFSVGNIQKYLSRYIATGGQKTKNKKDLLKAIHYLFFLTKHHSLHNE